MGSASPREAPAPRRDLAPPGEVRGARVPRLPQEARSLEARRQEDRRERPVRARPSPARGKPDELLEPMPRLHERRVCREDFPCSRIHPASLERFEGHEQGNVEPCRWQVPGRITPGRTAGKRKLGGRFVLTAEHECARTKLARPGSSETATRTPAATGRPPRGCPTRSSRCRSRCRSSPPRSRAVTIAIRGSTGLRATRSGRS